MTIDELRRKLPRSYATSKWASDVGALDVGVFELWRAYRGASTRTRLHVIGRSILCPMARVVERVPRSKRVLDIGCGHGLFAYFLARARVADQILGIDLDAGKIDEARRATLPSSDARFDAIDFRRVSATDFDVITLVDVLYLIPDALYQELISWLYAHVRPGGVVLIKEVGTTPKWKYWVNMIEETLAVRVLRITLGDRILMRPPERMERDLAARGFTVEAHRIDRGYLHPHVLLVARRDA